MDVRFRFAKKTKIFRCRSFHISPQVDSLSFVRDENAADNDVWFAFVGEDDESSGIKKGIRREDRFFATEV